MNRRRALATLAALAAAGVTGCAGEPPLRIAVVWSGFELRIFETLLKAYQRPTVVYSAGDNIAALLRHPVAAAATPDVAIVPRPGLVRDPGTCGRLQPTPVSTDPPFWQDLVTCENYVRGVWLKASHKSLIWHRPGAGGYSSWEEWVDRLGREAAARSAAPLSIGAADGWVLTDWFENVLLAVDTDRAVYERLASGTDPDLWSDEKVHRTLTRLGELWSIPGLLPGGGERALTLQFHESVLDVFRFGNAITVAAPDFAWQVIKVYDPERAGAASDPARIRSRFPGVPDVADQPVLVGGDAVVALRSGGDRAQGFLRWLTGPSSVPANASRDPALRQWAQAGGFTPFTWHTGYPPLIQPLAKEIGGTAPNIAFDLSDRLSGGLSGGDGQGLWRILTAFFADVTVNAVPVPRAVATATAAMSRAAARGRPGVRRRP